MARGDRVVTVPLVPACDAALLTSDPIALRNPSPAFPGVKGFESVRVKFRAEPSDMWGTRTIEPSKGSGIPFG